MTDGAASSSSASSVHGAFSCSRKRFSNSLSRFGDQVVLAVDGVLEAEVVENGSQELAAFRMCEAVRYLEVRPESVLGNDLVEVQVVDVQQGTLFQVGKNNAPAATEIRKSPEEQVILECLFVLFLDRGQFGLCVTVAVIAERQ